MFPMRRLGFAGTTCIFNIGNMCGNKLDSKYKRCGTAGLCGFWQTEIPCPGGLECDLGCVAGVSTPFFAAVDRGSASGPLGAQLVLSSTPGLLS